MPNNLSNIKKLIEILKRLQDRVIGVLLILFGVYLLANFNENVLYNAIGAILVLLGGALLIQYLIKGDTKQEGYESVYSDDSSIWDRIAYAMFTEKLHIVDSEVEIIMAANSLWGAFCPKELENDPWVVRVQKLNDPRYISKVFRHELSGDFWHTSGGTRENAKWGGIADLIENREKYGVKKIQLKLLLLHPAHPQVAMIKSAQQLASNTDNKRNAFEDIYSSLYVIWLLHNHYATQDYGVDISVCMLKDEKLYMNFAFYQLIHHGLYVSYPYDSLVDSSNCIYITTNQLNNSVLGSVSNKLRDFIDGNRTNYKTERIDLSKIEHDIFSGYKKFLYDLTESGIDLNYFKRIKLSSDNVIIDRRWPYSDAVVENEKRISTPIFVDSV